MKRSTEGSPWKSGTLTVQPECKGESHPWGAAYADSGGRWGYYTLFPVSPVLAMAASLSPVEPQGCAGDLSPAATVNNASGLSIFTKGSRQHRR